VLIKQFALALSVAAILSTGSARAGFIDSDILLARNTAGTGLVTGFYLDQSNTYGMSQRVFGGLLQPGSYDGDEPGIRGVTVAPPDALTLPASTMVRIDLLPITIGVTSSNLFYWDGNGAVDFQNVATGYSLNVNAIGGYSLTADGTNTTIIDQSANGFVTTGNGGFIHRHADFTLSNSNGTPAEGIYLISLGFRMPTTSLTPADPVYNLLATSTIDDLTRVTAAEWVNVNVASVPEPSSMALLGFAAAGFLGRKLRRRR